MSWLSWQNSIAQGKNWWFNTICAIELNNICIIAIKLNELDRIYSEISLCIVCLFLYRQQWHNGKWNGWFRFLIHDMEFCTIRMVQFSMLTHILYMIHVFWKLCHNKMKYSLEKHENVLIWAMTQVKLLIEFLNKSFASYYISHYVYNNIQ